MPEKFRRTGVRTEWADVNQGGRLADSFLEGPVFDTQGNLYVTDIPFGRVFRIDHKGEWDLVAQWEGEPNGMKFLNDTELLVTDYKNGLMRLNIQTGQVQTFLERRNSESFKGVNDLVLDSRGNVLHRPRAKRHARPLWAGVQTVARWQVRPVAEQRAQPQWHRTVTR